jgi:hypothetical protein
MLLLGRCVCALGERFFLAVYAFEIAPRAKRGRVAGASQLLISTGIMTGYFVCYGNLRIAESASWKSPRWLLLVEREEAERVVGALGIVGE